MKSSDQSKGGEAYREDVRREQCLMLSNQTLQSLVGGIVVAVFLFSSLLALVGAQLAVALFLPIVLIMLLRGYWNFKGRTLIFSGLGEWYAYFCFHLSIAGCLWALCIGVMIVHGDSISVLVAMIVGFALISGSVASTAATFLSYVVYTLPIALASIVSLYFRGEYSENLFHMYFFAFYFANLMYAWRFQQSLLEMIEIKQDNQYLMKIQNNQNALLSKKNIEVERAVNLAEDANRAKSMFLAAASHDLAQPMHALRLFLGALSNKMPEVERQELVEKASRSCESLSGLFREILDISRLDSGTVRSEISCVTLDELLGAVTSEFEMLAMQKGLVFESVIPELSVQTDPSVVQRIVRNLLSNALNHTQAGRVGVSAYLQGGTVFIEVFDTGVGIPQSEKSRIFEEFYQVGNAERDRSKGLGLGLAIVKRLASLLEIDLFVESKLGEGTTVRFSIGSIVEGIDGRGMSVVPEKSKSDSAPIVLFVDDEPEIRAGMALLFKSWGMLLVTAESAKHGLLELAAKSYIPDLVVSDYRLRERETGLDVIRKVREEFNDEVPSLILTGDSSPEVLRRISECGIQMVNKLDTSDELYSKIVRLLEKSN